MSEPTPLSAKPYSPAELAKLIAYGEWGDWCDPKDANRLLATAADQATEIAERDRAYLSALEATDAQEKKLLAEIAALKGALEKTAEFLNGLAKADALPIGIADIQQEGARLDAIVLRVLAGKEAQR